MAICILLFCEFCLTVLSTGSFVRFKGTPGWEEKSWTKSWPYWYIFLLCQNSANLERFCWSKCRNRKKHSSSQRGKRGKSKFSQQVFFCCLPSLLYFHLNQFFPLLLVWEFEWKTTIPVFLRQDFQEDFVCLFFHVHMKIQSVFFKLFKVTVYTKTCL